jgi:hypothetical protein
MLGKAELAAGRRSGRGSEGGVAAILFANDGESGV